jgi:hypothetical protein
MCIVKGFMSELLLKTAVSLVSSFGSQNRLPG